MKPFSMLLCAAAAFVVPLVITDVAQAKRAKCFNSNDGYYRCNFQSFGGNGSFTISARGYPTITLEIIRRGVSAEGYIDFGDGRERAMPGTYKRSRKDRACWINSASIAQVCAWGL